MYSISHGMELQYLYASYQSLPVNDYYGLGTGLMPRGGMIGVAGNIIITLNL